MADLVLEPVSVRGDDLMLRLADGRQTPIKGLAVLAPGWHARCLFCGFATVWLLELAHEDGREGTLFLSPDAKLLTHEIECLPRAILADIAATVASWRADRRSPAARHAVAAFEQLNCRTRGQIPLSGFLPDIVFDPVCATGPETMLRRADGSTFTVKFDGAGAEAASTWPGGVLFTLFTPLLLLPLPLDANSQSPHPETWFLHEDGTVYGTSLDDVPPFLLDLVSKRGGRLMRQIDAGLGRFDVFRLLHAQTWEAIAALLPRNDDDQRLDHVQSRLAHDAAEHSFETIDLINPSAAPDSFARRAPGWFTDDANNAWIVAGSSPITIEVPYSAVLMRLRLDIAHVRKGMRITVRANGVSVSSHSFGHLQDSATVLTCFIADAPISGNRLDLGFTFEPPLVGADAGFRLDRLALSASTRRRDRVVPSDRALLDSFVSLGANCELGFVQRHFQLESLGLLRFAGTWSLACLIELFDTGFAGLGAPGSLRSTINLFEGKTEYMIWADHAGLFYHTWRSPDDISQEDVIAENETKLAYLGRKLIEDLEDGEKIFVYKHGSRGDLGEMLSLHGALNRYGPARLFWISRLEAGRRPGDVEWVGPNLLRGYMAGFGRAEAPCVNAWLTLCRNAHAAFHMPPPQHAGRREEPAAEPPSPRPRTAFDLLAAPAADTHAEVQEARDEGLLARLRARMMPRLR